MKTDVIYIDNQGNGFDNVIKDFHKFATYMELDSKESLRLQLCAEEMLMRPFSKADHSARTDRRPTRNSVSPFWS